MGISWLIAGYALWQALFGEGTYGILFSHTEKDAQKLLGKAIFIWQNLPPFLRMARKHSDSRELLDFDESASQIEAYPSTAKAGRGTDATLCIRDELRDHEKAREHFNAIGPAIDSGGQSIDLSTIDKESPDSHFTERVYNVLDRIGGVDWDAEELFVENSGVAFIFLGWALRPVRQEGLTLEEWWERNIVPKYSKSVIEGEYPRTLKEALKPLETRAFFDIQATEDMLMHVIPQELEAKSDVEDFNGKVRVYKPPVVGEKYVIFTDPSDGKDDPFHTVVIHARTFEGVAEAYSKVPADICAKIHDSLVRAYNNAYNDYEVNATAGGKFDESIKALETPNVASRRDTNGNVMKDRSGKEIKGWWTSNQWKRKMLWGLEEAIRNHLIISHNKDTINQFKGFILPEGEDPRPSRGMHDDAIMAWAGAWQIRKYAPVGDMKFSTDKYKVM